MFAMIWVSVGYGTDGSRTPTTVAALEPPRRTVCPSDRRIAVEYVLPETVRQHDRARRAFAIIGGGQEPAKHRAKAHHLEERSVDDAGPDQTRLSAESDQREIDGGEIAEGSDGLRARLEVINLGDRERHVLDAEALSGLADIDQSIRLPIDERPQEDAANHAENRRVGADAQGKRYDDGRGQAFGAEKRTEGEPDVSHERFSRVVPAAVPDAPHRIADGANVTEFPQRGAARRLGILAALDSFPHTEVQVAADFLVQILLVRSHCYSSPLTASAIAVGILRP